MTRDEARRKIEKLEALAMDSGATPSERETAMLRAKAIRRTYRINRVIRKTKAKVKTEPIVEPSAPIVDFDIRELRRQFVTSLNIPITVKFGTEGVFTFTPRMVANILFG